MAKGSEKAKSTYWSVVKWLFQVVAVTVAYFIVGLLQLQFSANDESALPLWLPAGIGLATLIIFGYRLWPSILIGAGLVGVLSTESASEFIKALAGGSLAEFYNLAMAVAISKPFATLGVAAVTTLGAVVGAYFVNRFAHGRFCLDLPTDVFKFLFFGGMLGSAITAAFGVVTLAYFGELAWGDFNYSALSWWLRDALGALVMAPLMIAWLTQRRSSWHRRQVLEIILLLSGLSLITYLVFGGPLASVARAYSLVFLVVPFLIWAAYRFGQRGATATILVLTTIVVCTTVNGSGPFVITPAYASIFEMQAFLCVSAMIAIMLAALVFRGRLNEERFRDLIEHSFDGIALLDREAKVYYASPSTKQILGFSPVDVTNQEFFKMVDNDDRERVRTMLTELVNNAGKTINIEMKMKRKDGKVVWVESTATNLLTEPTVQAIVVDYRDITDRKQAEHNLKLYNARLAEEKAKDEALIASIGDGIIATDAQGKIIRVNRAFEAMTGLEPEDVVTKTTAEVLQVEDEKGQHIPDEERSLYRAFNSGQRVEATHYIVKQDGSKFPANITATPIMYEGQVIGAIEVLHDITKEKQIDRAKTEFVALASHQLRSPLAAVNWYGEALLSGKSDSLSAEQKKYLDVIYRSNQRMIHLVNALLNVSRIELGTFMVTPEPTRLVDVAKTVVEEVQPKIKEKNIEFTMKFDNIPVIEADPKLTWTMLMSLLENAVKYTPAKGKVDFTIKQVKAGVSMGGKKTSDESVVFIFRDTGCGIPRAQQDRIFTKFFRADNAMKVDPDGNGLGLYIVKTLVDNLGGSVWFDSEENKGTTFYLSLPLTGMQKKEGTKRLT